MPAFYKITNEKKQMTTQARTFPFQVIKSYLKGFQILFFSYGILKKEKNGFRGQCLLHVFYEPYSSEKPGVLQSVGPRRHDLATEQNNNIVQYAITSFVSHKNHSKFTTILHRNRRKTILNISSPRQQKIWFNFKLHLYLSKGCHFHIRLLT